MSAAWSSKRKGKAYELEVCAAIRDATGWSEEQVHRHDAEDRAGEAGVGDVVTPAPVLLQVRARKRANGWSALEAAEAAASGQPGLWPWGVACRAQRRGQKRSPRLVLMRDDAWAALQREAGHGCNTIRRERALGVFRHYEQLLEELEMGRLGEFAFRCRKRGTEEWAVVLEQEQAWWLMARAWATDTQAERGG